MQTVRDSFLHFLADNLTGVTVHALRRDPDNPSSDKLQLDQINVGFGVMACGELKANLDVHIDICADLELDAVSWMTQVWKLLGAQLYTPQLDYTNPASPVALGTMIMWRDYQVKFRSVYSDFYFQYSCSLPLEFFIY